MCFDGYGLGLFFRTGDGDNGAKRREKLDSLIKEWGEGGKGGEWPDLRRIFPS